MWTLEAGRSTSCSSYGQLSDIVVVKGMKKFWNETNGLPCVSRSRNFGLESVSRNFFHLVLDGLATSDEASLPWKMVEPTRMTNEKL